MKLKKEDIKLAILLPIVAAALIYSFFYDVERKDYMKNSKYTIAVFRNTGYVVSPSSHSVYYFDYYVDGVKYVASTTAALPELINTPSHPLRFIVKYSVERPSTNDLIVVPVPSWVLESPKEGWTEYPPDIHWAGAVLDTAYIDSIGEKDIKNN